MKAQEVKRHTVRNVVLGILGGVLLLLLLFCVVPLALGMWEWEQGEDPPEQRTECQQVIDAAPVDVDSAAYREWTERYSEACFE